MKKALFYFIATLVIGIFLFNYNGFSSVLKEGEKTYIVDRTGEKWDITQAVSIGFKPKNFQYGIGRNAFTPLDESFLTDNTKGVSSNLRVIGISEGSVAQAYSVMKLSRHEIANSILGSKPVAVGY
jgi:Trk-type K+ transport system membrane component